MPVRIITPTTEEPIDLEEARAHLRVDHDYEDDTIGALIAAARDLVEGHTGRALVARTLEMTADRFPGPCKALRLEWPPALEVASISYIDPDGATQVWPADQYQVDTRSVPARILPMPGASWPATADRLGAVTVAYTAGYGASADVPAGIKAAMKLLIGQWYANREAVNVGNIVNEMPFAVKALLSRYVVIEVA